MLLCLSDMSYTVTKYPEGTFSWVDEYSTDPEKSKEFLNKFFGWESKDMPTPQGMDYTMFTLDGKNAAGLSPMPQDMQGVPSHFSNYVTVGKLEDAIKKVEQAGGKVFMPAMDVMTAGRMAGIQDPTGAMLMIWEPKDHIGAQVVNKVGAMGWNELLTNDLEKAKEFYSKVFGWEYDTDEKSGYTTIKNKGRMNGGMMAITPEMGDTPPTWMPYFTVAKIDEAVTKAKELGGKFHMEVTDMEGVGKFVIIEEPAGAVFIAIELATEPEHWVE